ncbi:hypothetical protein M569_17079 [Genlisea aurea]|uniref:Uncharacterized protein n=1 Tax=Genlisea aurea TaxID=192259 RepID=S8BTM3_9LAMI|nr:hypothetical protein M569_17079 [Genlisea aurea]
MDGAELAAGVHRRERRRRSPSAAVGGSEWGPHEAWRRRNLDDLIGLGTVPLVVPGVVLITAFNDTNQENDEQCENHYSPRYDSGNDGSVIGTGRRSWGLECWGARRGGMQRRRRVRGRIRIRGGFRRGDAARRGWKGRVW